MFLWCGVCTGTGSWCSSVDWVGAIWSSGVLALLGVIHKLTPTPDPVTPPRGIWQRVSGLSLSNFRVIIRKGLWSIWNKKLLAESRLPTSNFKCTYDRFSGLQAVNFRVVPTLNLWKRWLLAGDNKTPERASTAGLGTVCKGKCWIKQDVSPGRGEFSSVVCGLYGEQISWGGYLKPWWGKGKSEPYKKYPFLGSHRGDLESRNGFRRDTWSGFPGTARAKLRKRSWGPFSSLDTLL